MKRLQILLLIWIPFFAFSQTDSVITYTGVSEVSGASKTDLYLKAVDWFNVAFNRSKDAIQFQDKEAGQVSGKGGADIIMYNEKGKMGAVWYVKFKVNFWVKDGRYKYEFTDINPMSRDGDIDLGLLNNMPTTNKKIVFYSAKKVNDLWSAAKRGCDSTFITLSRHIEKHMASKPKSDF